MKKTDFVVRFAGEAGQGVLTSAEGLAQAAAQEGYHVQTFATFPSQIMGGPTWAQARISTSPVLSSGDELDVLVAFNGEAYERHKDEVADSGVVVYDSAAFQIESGGAGIGMPVEELAKSTGNPRAANMVVMGALARLVNMPQSVLEQFVKKRFTRGRAGDEGIIKSNIAALSLGREQAAESGMKVGSLAEPVRPDGEQVLMNGNQALSLGACAAGLEFYIGYPISPASSILMWMQGHLVGPRRFAYQASSEIEAIGSLLGAGFAGRKAMSATSGPGFSLMSEGLGLAWMAEIPLVVANIQRGGPSTGLPTKTEQSDLMVAMYPGHGDMRLPVIAPGTVEECFYAAVMALNWAERYQGPVILLSEHALSERQQNIPKPDLSELLVENRVAYRGEDGYKRYDSQELSPMPIPDNPGVYVANGSEHDGMGDTTHRPERHVQMTQRRFGKLKLLEDGEYEAHNTDASVAVVPWGGSKGPALEAYRQLGFADEDIAWYYSMYLNPLPPGMLEELRRKELVIVPELNFQGQFSAILRSYGVKAESITQYSGLPFKVKYLVDKIGDLVEQHRRVGVPV